MLTGGLPHGYRCGHCGQDRRSSARALPARRPCCARMGDAGSLSRRGGAGARGGFGLAVRPRCATGRARGVPLPPGLLLGGGPLLDVTGIGPAGPAGPTTGRGHHPASVRPCVRASARGPLVQPSPDDRRRRCLGAAVGGSPHPRTSTCWSTASATPTHLPRRATRPRGGLHLNALSCGVGAQPPDWSPRPNASRPTGSTGRWPSSHRGLATCEPKPCTEASA